MIKRTLKRRDIMKDFPDVNSFFWCLTNLEMQPYLCCEDLKDYVEVPKSAEKLHVTIHDNPGKDRVKVERVDDYRVCVEDAEKNIAITEAFADDLPHNVPVYVKIQYE